jgi:DNA-binding MarR family transcriptional regulator
MISDVQLVVGAYPRVLFACRPRLIRPPAGAATLSPHQASILVQLDVEDPAMVTELAEFMGVTASTMSLNLSRLETSGFVRRSRDPDDGRVVNVRLTDVGQAARDAATTLDPARVDALLRVLRPDDRRRAVEGLVVLAEAADALVVRGGEQIEGLVGSHLGSTGMGGAP